MVGISVPGAMLSCQLGFLLRFSLGVAIQFNCVWRACELDTARSSHSKTPTCMDHACRCPSLPVRRPPYVVAAPFCDDDITDTPRAVSGYAINVPRLPAFSFVTRSVLFRFPHKCCVDGKHAPSTCLELKPRKGR
uniref:Secreted protein n=1 Tax=Coccidioides posadasii RMSCC 3488 TaxID=454284 RepID=A0A0J6FRB8_COCPO|nr:hypothetical protein CPAG_08295 [Coccidioides posadasii RMSCC 3488]